jgi:hypothetical protein
MGHHPLGALIVGTGFGVLAHVRAMQAAGINVHALVGRDAAKRRIEQRGSTWPSGLTKGSALASRVAASSSATTDPKAAF